MNFRAKAFHTLNQSAQGILGSEMYSSPQGAAAYERIVRSKNYYLARADIDNWRACAREITNHVPLGIPVVEYGTGVSTVWAQKTRSIVSQLECEEYVGVDLNRNSLDRAVETISSVNPYIHARGIEVDFWDGNFPRSSVPTLSFLAGFSLQNLEVPTSKTPPEHALTQTLSILSHRANSGWLLVSVDMWCKNFSSRYYASAYKGWEHAAFNLGVFERIANEFDTTLDPKAFSYKPIFNRDSGAVEHWACATKTQNILFEGMSFCIRRGELFLLQNSFRFKEDFFNRCVSRAGLHVEHVWRHPIGTSSLYLLKVNTRPARSCGLSQPAVHDTLVA